MKGLLLKDFYQVVKYCRSYLLICLVFLGLSLFAPDSNAFFTVYPCLLASMIPVNLISYDTASRWEVMSLTLPYSRSQLVTAKYLVGLLCEMAVLLLTVLCQGLKTGATGVFSAEELGALGVTLFTISLLLPALMLPLIFKLGVEKGRTLYLAGIGILMAVCGIGYARIAETGSPFQFSISPIAQTVALPLLSIALYILSWRLSIRFYEKRDF